MDLPTRYYKELVQRYATLFALFYEWDSDEELCKIVETIVLTATANTIDVYDIYGNL